MKVGVIGLGGLGHMAVQFARAFGCEVSGMGRTTFCFVGFCFVGGRGGGYDAQWFCEGIWLGG